MVLAAYPMSEDLILRLSSEQKPTERPEASTNFARLAPCNVILSVNAGCRWPASIALLAMSRTHGPFCGKTDTLSKPEDGMARSKCPSCEASSVERVRRRFWMRWLFRKRYRCNCCGSYMYEIVTTLAEPNQRPLSLGLALYMAMRSLLSAIAMSFHVLKAAGDTNPILVSVRDMMRRQARHLKRLLKDLLALARITRDRIELQVSATDIRKCVQDEVDGNHPLTQKKRTS